MTALRWFLFLIGAVCIGLTFARMTVDGVTVAGAVLWVLWAWSVGVFSLSFWITDDPDPDALGSLDEVARMRR